MIKRFLLQFCLSLLMCSLFVPCSNARQVQEQGRKESLHGVLLKRELQSPLRSDIEHIRFSLDGKYVLAQDEAGISVLTREPFAVLFRIEALDVSWAQFSSDSQEVVFYTRELSVQRWGVAERKLKFAQNVAARAMCQQTELSPDARTLACLEDGGDLVLFDVATSAQIYRKKSFYVLGDFAALFEFLKEGVSRNFNFVRGKVINMDFSPDGRYFAAGAKSARDNEFLERNATVTSASKSGFPDGYTHYPENISEYGTTYRVGINTPERVLEALAFDLHARKQVSLGGSLKNLLTGRFTFVGADRLVGAHADDSSKSALVAFPSGEIVKPLSLGKGYLDAPGRGNYVLIRPIDKYPVGVMNLADGALFMANKQPALDIYDNVYVAARADGELGLYGVEKSDLRAKVQLPPSPLGPLEAAALSPDFRWLAVSGRTRGAVWDLNNGERIFHVRRFRSAHFAEGGAFYVDFPAQETIKRTIGILNPQRREALNGWEIEKIQGVRSSQMGQFFLSFRPAGKEKSSRKNALLDVKDVTSMKTLWSKAFPKETPSIWGDARNEMMVFGWNISTEAAKAEIKSDAVLSKRLAAMKEKEGDYFLQVVDAHTGEQRGRLLIETGKGSFVIWDVFVIGDRVVIGDSNNRVLVYSMTSGEQTGQVIGGHATVSKNSGLLCVENEKGQLTIYELATMQKRDEFSFSSPVSLARFSNDGKRLFVLTTSHTVYVLDVSSLSKSV